MIESEARDAIVSEAKTWLRTPWHHRGCVKGAGVDCVFLLVGVYNAVGIADIKDADIPYYPADIMMNRNSETVLEEVMRRAYEVDAPDVGDIAVWKFGRIYSHAAIVTAWPEIIHAHRRDGMVVMDSGCNGELINREVKFFSFWGGK